MRWRLQRHCCPEVQLHFDSSSESKNRQYTLLRCTNHVYDIVASRESFSMNQQSYDLIGQLNAHVVTLRLLIGCCFGNLLGSRMKVSAVVSYRCHDHLLWKYLYKYKKKYIFTLYIRQF